MPNFSTTPPNPPAMPRARRGFDGRRPGRRWRARRTAQHPRVVEFCTQASAPRRLPVQRRADLSDIWRIQGEGTYKEETPGEGELHAQEIERTCGVDIALRWVNGYDTTP